MSPIRLLTVLAIASAVATAGPLTPIYSSAGAEPALLSTLDAVYGPGSYSRVDDASDAVWTGPGTVSAIAISSHAGATQRFGICVVCDGSDDILFDPPIVADGVFSQLLTADGHPSVLMDTPLFRFFNDPTQHDSVGRVHSDPALNPLHGDHMVTFALDGSPGVYVLGFEDWLFTSNPASDRDYNDLVVQVSIMRPDIVATPEPGTVTLLGCGLLLAVRICRRRGLAGKAGNRPRSFGR